MCILIIHTYKYIFIFKCTKQKGCNIVHKDACLELGQPKGKKWNSTLLIESIGKI